MQGLPHDLRSALRRIGAEPLLAATIVLTLACGIGASAAIFSFVNALLLRPFPFKDPDRLVQVFGLSGAERSRLSVQETSDLNQRARLFEGFAAHRDSAYNYGDDGGPAEHLLITRATQNLFTVLGVAPILGGAWDPVQDRSRAFAIVLGHDLWRRRFHSDPNIIGKQVLMDGFPNTVVGVAAPGFDFPSRSALFRCWGIDRDPNTYVQRDRRTAIVVGRLKPGVTLDQGRAELRAISTQLSVEYPATNRSVRFDLAPLKDLYIG
jgi:putative ABC transport system permease protein